MRKMGCYLAVLVLLPCVSVHSTVFAATSTTIEQARAIALARTGGGIVTECELDVENGKQVYELEVINGGVKHKLEIDAGEAQISRYQSKTYANYNPNGVQEITAEKAQEIALAKTGGGSVTDCKLDFENGRKVYEIDIARENWKYEVDVDVVAAVVCSFEKKALQGSVDSSSPVKEITMERAKEIALQKTGGGVVTECDLDWEHGRKVYEMEVVNGNMKYEMDVCVTDSQIYEFEQHAGAVPGVASTVKEITAEKAKEIALAKTGGGTVMKCTLDDDDGRTVYEIEIRNGRMEYDLEIGAHDAQIYEFDQEVED